jgi:hypothetical protein
MTPATVSASNAAYERIASLIQAARQLPGPLFLVNLIATMKTCFSIMPFKDGFEDIDRIIGEASKECGLDYVRGDRQHHPGSILPQILRNIREAAVVVADTATMNRPIRCMAWITRKPCWRSGTV